MQGNPEAATSLFVSAIEAEKAKEESRALPLLYIQYARFLDQVMTFKIMIQCVMSFLLPPFYLPVSEA